MNDKDKKTGIIKMLNTASALLTEIKKMSFTVGFL